MKEFKIYYKTCGVKSEIKTDVAIGFFSSGEGGVHLKDGGWNPLESTYLTRKQAEDHFCNCVSCQADRLPDTRKYQPCPDCEKTQKILKNVKEFIGDI